MMSIPKYSTVFSILECPSRIWMARGLAGVRARRMARSSKHRFCRDSCELRSRVRLLPPRATSLPALWVGWNPSLIQEGEETRRSTPVCVAKISRTQPEPAFETSVEMGDVAETRIQSAITQADRAAPSRAQGRQHRAEVQRSGLSTSTTVLPNSGRAIADIGRNPKSL